MPVHHRAVAPPAALVTIKVAHTIVWVFFVGCILAIPAASWMGEHSVAGWLVAVVFLEVAVLAANGWRCPLTALAARHTEDRRHNFDIYLPEWMARNNQRVFGMLYLAGAAFALARWASG